MKLLSTRLPLFTIVNLQMNQLILLISLLVYLRTLDGFVLPSTYGSTQRFHVKESFSPGCFAPALSLSKSLEIPDGDDKPASRLVLDQALNGNGEAASSILTKIKSLREEGSEDDLKVFLDSILSLVDEDKPAWTKLRVSARFSKRARRASLRRLLVMSTPSSSDAGIETEDERKSRRRRALVVSLRTLVPDASASSEASIRGIKVRKLEKSAIKDLKEKSTSKELGSRIPDGLETPKYDVIAKRNNFEIRNYERFSVCSVKMSQPRPDSSTTDRKVSQPQLPGASSFGALAGYLFGKNKDQLSMKMTTPVLTTGEGDDKEMAFVLPSSYWDEDSLQKAPLPLDNSLVQLKGDEGGKRAVKMFGGLATSKDIELKKKVLIESLEGDKEWEICPNANTVIAQYNDPFTPPWKRLNEISVPVQPKR